MCFLTFTFLTPYCAHDYKHVKSESLHIKQPCGIIFNIIPIVAAFKFWASLLQERSVRQFLLTNLVEQNGHYAWRVNLEAISAHLDDLISFPNFNTVYEGPTLFLGGASSAYIRYFIFQNVYCTEPIETYRAKGSWLKKHLPEKLVILGYFCFAVLF